MNYGIIIDRNINNTFLAQIGLQTVNSLVPQAGRGGFLWAPNIWRAFGETKLGKGPEVCSRQVVLLVQAHDGAVDVIRVAGAG
ncbi:MAG: hypothetical protein H8E30_07220 [Alphaproteobacteria bacterium]|nr:hypothetical protein [Alphaproteobacteria bacterium]